MENFWCIATHNLTSTFSIYLSLNNQDGNLPDLRWNNNNLKWEIIVVFGCDQTPDTPDRYIFTTVWIWLKFQTKVLKMSNFTSLLIQENLLPAWSLNKHFLVGANWHKTWVICIYTNPQKVSVPYFPLHETWCEGWRCTAGVRGCHEVVLALVTQGNITADVVDTETRQPRQYCAAQPR